MKRRESVVVDFDFQISQNILENQAPKIETLLQISAGNQTK